MQHLVEIRLAERSAVIVTAVVKFLLKAKVVRHSAFTKTDQRGDREGNTQLHKVGMFERDL